MYDFSKFGSIIGFKLKIIKHINADNSDRVCDYLSYVFKEMKIPFEEYKNHPCSESIQIGIDFVKKQGWKISGGKKEGEKVKFHPPSLI